MKCTAGYSSKFGCAMFSQLLRAIINEESIIVA
jgi:hypothetical protein